jgi:error-prone DNA polymerase
VAYVELRARSNFSFLEGASHPEELVETAVALGLRGLALCDVNGLYGVAKGYRKAKEHSGFKYIVGATVKVLAPQSETQFLPELQVIALDRMGYGRLCRMVTRSHADKDKGQAHLRWSEFVAELETREASGLWLIPDVGRETSGVASAPVVQGTSPVPRWLKDLVEITQRRMSLPLTRYFDGLDRRRTRHLKSWQKMLDLKLVATNDVRYHVKDRRVLHDVLRATNYGYSLKESGFRLDSNSERYLKSPNEMMALYRDEPEALQESLAIAERVTFCLSQLRYRYPSEWIPKDLSAFEYLNQLVWQGACQRYGRTMSDLPTAVTQQLEKELQLIQQLKFEDYFLTIYDIVEFARSRDILCQGRGSAANSVVCYVLGITAIDPIQMELLFERFLSVERGEPPDIDVDFEHERREEVIQYIYEKYGRDRAAMVSAVITYRKRSAVREVAKAFGFPVGTLSAKKVEQQLAAGVNAAGTAGGAASEKLQAVIAELKGFPRHLSIHSGGFTLSADPIVEIVPIEPARMPGRTIIQWDKYDLDELGLLKVDILSLGMLSALKKTLQHVGLELHQVPHDDPATYDMIRRVDTVGTFQIESRAQMSMLGRLQPKNFYDLVIEVAIVRPGPIVGQMVHPFLRRRRGLEKIEFPHPELKKVLGKTLGVPLFQEQVMKLAISLAGFTPGEADELRRAIGAWRSSGSIQKMGDRLRSGLLRSGLTKEFADQFFEQIKGFAHYGFPESHAASFALIAYVSCYLKCHHPAAFAASLVNSQPMGFYSPYTILADAERHGVQVLPLDLQNSGWDCEILTPTLVRIGFRLVQGMSERSAAELLRLRAERPFTSLVDFLRRTTGVLRPEVHHRLAMAAAFKLFGLEPREALWNILRYQTEFQEVRGGQTQMSLFMNYDWVSETEVPSGSGFAPLSELEILQEDFRAYGVTTHGHPMALLRKMFRDVPETPLVPLKSNPRLHGRKVKAAGMIIIRQKPPTAKGVCFCTMEDESGFLDLTFWPNVYDRYKHVFLNHAFIIVWGTLQKDEHSSSLLVDRVAPIFNDADHLDQTPLPIEPQQYFY